MSITTKSLNINLSLESEQAVLGSVLISNKMIPLIRAYVSPDRFYNRHLGIVFEIACNLFDSKSPVDLVSISDELRRKGLFDTCGGSEFLSEIINSVGFADHGEYYAKIVARYYYEREIVSSVEKVAVNPSSETFEALGQLVLAREQLGLPSAFDYSKDLFDILDRILKKKTGRSHTVGFPALDRAFGGLTPGEVITWGAATNMGKSLVLLNILSHCGSKGEPSLYVGTEMSAQETVSRHLSILTSVEPHKIKSTNLTTEELSRLHNAISDRMFTMPIRILDLPEPSLSDVEAAITSWHPQVVFLDYLERFKMPSGDNYRLRVNEFMRRVKNLARRHNVVIHLASQLSREVYGSEERRPTLAHLSESSSIEKESDRVMLIWAPKDKNKDVSGIPGPRILEVVMAKNRHGYRGFSLDLRLDEKSLQINEFVPEVSETPEFQ